MNGVRVNRAQTARPFVLICVSVFISLSLHKSAGPTVQAAAAAPPRRINFSLPLGGHMKLLIS